MATAFIRTFGGLFTILLLALSTSAAHAQSQETLAEREKLAETLLLEMRYQLYTRDMLDMVNTALDTKSRNANISDNDLQRARDIARRIFRDKNILAVLKTALAVRTESFYLQQHLNWWRSEDGRKLQAAYDEFLRADGDAEAAAYYRRAESGGLSPNRINTLRTFIQVTDEQRIFSVKSTTAEIAAELGINAGRPAIERDSVKFIRKRAENKKRAYWRDGREVYEKLYTYAFRKLKNREIDAFTKAFATAGGAQVRENFHKALEDSLERAARTMYFTLAPDEKARYINSVGKPTRKKNNKVANGKGNQKQKPMPGKQAPAKKGPVIPAKGNNVQ